MGELKEGQEKVDEANSSRLLKTGPLSSGPHPWVSRRTYYKNDREANVNQLLES